MVDGKQESVCGSPKCYNGSAQLVQLKQLPHHREEAGTGVASLSTPQSQELFIDTSTRCLPLCTALALRESIVDILAGKNNARNPEDGTEDGIEDSDEEVYRMVMGSHPPQNQFCWSHRKIRMELKAI